MPKFGDEFLVALTQSRPLISPDQSTAIQEELSEGGTGEERRNILYIRTLWKQVILSSIGENISINRQSQKVTHAHTHGLINHHG